MGGAVLERSCAGEDQPCGWRVCPVHRRAPGADGLGSGPRAGRGARLEQRLEQGKAGRRRHAAVGAGRVLAGAEGGRVQEAPGQLQHGHVHIALAARHAPRSPSRTLLGRRSRVGTPQAWEAARRGCIVEAGGVGCAGAVERVRGRRAGARAGEHAAQQAAQERRSAERHRIFMGLWRGCWRSGVPVRAGRGLL